MPDAQHFLVKLIAVAAWASIALIAYATLTRAAFVYEIYYKISPFVMRPAIIAYAHVEHLVAFAILSALFYLAYPRRKQRGGVQNAKFVMRTPRWSVCHRGP